MSTDVLIWLLTAEVILLAVVFIVIIYFMGGKGKAKEREAVSVLLKKLKKQKNTRKDVSEELSELPAFDEDSLSVLLDEIHQKETNLYQHVVKIFLQKEAAHLKSLDKHVNSLSEPYWQAIKNLAANDVTQSVSGNDTKELQAALNIAIAEKERLGEQLASTLETLDSVSTEYTRMFSSSRDVDDLLESKEIMLDFYRQALETDKQQAEEDDIPVAYEKMEQI